jgi:hypothetical protein
LPKVQSPVKLLVSTSPIDNDAPLIGAFLDDLHQRKNGARARNARLAAIRSLFRYAALRHLCVMPLSTRVFSPSLPSALTEARDLPDRARNQRAAWTKRRRQYNRCCAKSLCGVAFLWWNQHPSLPAQGEQRRSSNFNIQLGNPQTAHSPFPQFAFGRAEDSRYICA